MLGFRWTANFANQVDGNWPNGQRNVLARIWARTRPVSGATSKVNDMRQNKKYGDKEAKIYLLGSVDKKELVTSPFFQSLQYGKGKNDGYWSYSHMVLHLEDCTDVFKVFYSQFDIVFELDHSSGHDKEKADGLTTTPSMLGWEHGGKQGCMRSSEL